MTYEELKRKAVEDIPETVERLGLERKGFSRSAGGVFSCPCCGHKLSCNFKNGRWYMRSFGQCNDFGGSGKYYNDSIGLIMAAEKANPDNQTWFEYAAREYGVEWKIGYKKEYTKEEKAEYAKKMRRQEEERKKKIEELKEKDREKNRLICDSVYSQSYGGAYEEDKKRLFAERGIIYETELSVWSKSGIGLMRSGKIPKKYDTGEYMVSGVVFSLGNRKPGKADGYQIRLMDHRLKSFVENSSKVFSVGELGLFNACVLDFVNEDENTLFVSESPFDALSIEAGAQRNYRPDRAFSISTQGVNNLKTLDSVAERLGNADFPVYIIPAFDNDEAGERASKELEKRFCTYNANGKGNFVVFAPLRHGGFKDANEFLCGNRNFAKNYYRFVFNLSKMVSSGVIAKEKADEVIKDVRSLDDVRRYVKELDAIEESFYVKKENEKRMVEDNGKEKGMEVER